MTTPTKRAEMIVHEQEPYNAEPPRAALAEHLITPVEVFYGRNHGTMPEIDPAGWRLRVGGMVEHVLEFSLAELREGFVPSEVTATLQCAGDRRAGLMAYRDIPPEADPPQPYGGSIPVAKATAPEVLLASEMHVALGAVALNSEILAPDDGDELPAGPTHVTGYAFAGDDRTVVRVDVTVDGGATGPG